MKHWVTFCLLFFAFIQNNVEARLGLKSLLGFKLSDCSKALETVASPSAKSVPNRWDIDGPGENYTSDFSRLFEKLGLPSNNNFFNETLIRRRENKLNTNVMDLFGSGFFVSNSNYDSMTGVRLEPMELSEDELKAGLKVPPQVYGDLTKLDTWRAIDKSLKDRRIPSLDLVVMRPYGGWRSIGVVDENNLRSITFIAEQVSKRLSKTGEFYFSIDHATSPFMLENYPEFIRLKAELRKQTPPKVIVLAYQRSANREGHFVTIGLIRPQNEFR